MKASLGSCQEGVTTDAILILKQTIEQHRAGQKDTLEKAYGQVPREEIWITMRERQVPEKYVKLVQDTYKGCRTKLRSVAWESSDFNVEVGLHQGSAMSRGGGGGGKGDEGSPIIDDVCRRHCTVRRQGSGHGGVLGDVEESFGREGKASQSTEDPSSGTFPSNRTDHRRRSLGRKWKERHTSNTLGRV